MKKIFLFYAVMIGINLLPFISMSPKGILGLAFVGISSVKFGTKNGYISAIVLFLLHALCFILGINARPEINFASMILGNSAYFAIAFYLGRTTDKFKKRNAELQLEIDKRKKTEADLQQKIELMRSLMSALPIPVCYKDFDGNYAGCNHEFMQWFGLSEEELIGKNVFSLMNWSQAEIHTEMEIQLLKTRKTQKLETKVTLCDGSVKNIICSKALIIDEQGNPNGVVVAMQDITLQKESEKLKKSIAEEELIINEMKKYDRLKTEFFSNISHELRTPLNVILSALQLLEQHFHDSCEMNHFSKIKKNMNSIKQNSLRLLRLVNNLLDVTKIDDHACEINLQNWNIVHVVEEIVLSVADYVSNKGLNLEFDTDTEEKIMACDEEKVERIMLNLLSNAIKYTPVGGNIFVHMYDQGDVICIKVRDTGVGIPREKQSDLFQRFCQVSPVFTRAHEGSGIGLSLVKSLVEMHNGSITVDSEPGKGTIFCVYLPCEKQNDIDLNRASLAVHRMDLGTIQLEFADIYPANEDDLLIC